MNGYNSERIKLLNMEIKKLIKSALLSSCVFFTVITFLYMLIVQIANIESDYAGMEAYRVLLIFVASVLFSIGNAVMKIKYLHVALGIITHYVIYLLAFYTCFLLPLQMAPNQTIIGVVLFTVLYAIVMTIVVIFKARLKANREKTSEYKSQFKKAK